MICKIYIYVCVREIAISYDEVVQISRVDFFIIVAYLRSNDILGLFGIGGGV